MNCLLLHPVTARTAAMSKRCARCEKTVYPIEELKCLDKVRTADVLGFFGDTKSEHWGPEIGAYLVLSTPPEKERLGRSVGRSREERRRKDALRKS